MADDTGHVFDLQICRLDALACPDAGDALTNLVERTLDLCAASQVSPGLVALRFMLITPLFSME